ncbi:hypothetical protein [uncultured Algibacter sp.]|uniref:hypothetical protein n=1 Tax=uncultured Algibacter sp. TaxID=298659 RepID=UPI00262AA9C5|nr:hypothetical protein [uncultured Algibacter sp.]
MEYKPDIRINNPIYLLRQVTELLKIAKEYKNSSSLIYACLECRIALELLDLNLILSTVKAEEREQIIEDSKPKNGIDRVNRRVGSLKHKYQLFFQAVCELFDFGNEYYDYKKSKDLQYKVSTYIHSYHMSNEQLEFDSENMQNCLRLIEEVDNFIKTSLPIENGAYIVLGIEIETLPEEDKTVLNEWKTTNSMEYDELKERLSENLKLRREKKE